MNSNQQLSKDPLAAAEILAALEEKDKDDSLCRFPTCRNSRQVVAGTGRPSAYCENPEHTAVTNHRIRQQLRAMAMGGTSEAASKRETTLPTGVAPVESLRASVVSRITQLQSDMERYLAALTEIADPDLAAAQIKTTLDRADVRVAEAQQGASAERSLRLAADMARLAAQEEARTERDAAELAIQRMEEAEARANSQLEEVKQHITKIQAERDDTVSRVREETQRQMEEITSQAKQDVALAQVATAAAVEQAQKEGVRARDAEAEAHVRTTTAERLVSEVNANLARERNEIGRLHQELADVRKQADIERADARANLERERTEVDRLRKELADAHKHTEQVTERSDRLALLTDELRTQLLQIQIKERENREVV